MTTTAAQTATGREAMIERLRAKAEARRGDRGTLRARVDLTKIGAPAGPSIAGLYAIPIIGDAGITFYAEWDGTGWSWPA